MLIHECSNLTGAGLEEQLSSGPVSQVIPSLQIEAKVHERLASGNPKKVVNLWENLWEIYGRSMGKCIKVANLWEKEFHTSGRNTKNLFFLSFWERGCAKQTRTILAITNSIIKCIALVLD